MTKRPLVAQVRTWTRLVTIAAILPLACGDDGQASESDGDTASTNGTTLGSTGDTSTTAASTSASASDSDAGTDSEGNTTTTTATTNTSETDTSTGTDATTTTTGDTSTTGVSATDTDATTTTTTGDTTGDTTTGSTTGPNCEGMGGEDNALSVIWIANSGQGTVSKIKPELYPYRAEYADSGRKSPRLPKRCQDRNLRRRNRAASRPRARSRFAGCADSPAWSVDTELVERVPNRAVRVARTSS